MVRNYSCFSIFEMIVDFGISPAILSTASPDLKIKILGSPLTEYVLAMLRHSSTLTFANFTLSLYVSAISSTTGPNFLQGPHHVAQKIYNNRNF